MAFTQDIPPAVRREPNYNTRSEPIKVRRFHYDRLPVALIGWFLLGLWWASGGKYTIDGLPLFFNMVFDFFHAPVSLPPVSDWHWYLWLCWLPVAISVIERRNRPRKGLAWSVTIGYAIGVWVAVSLLDLGSTWLAVTTPRPDDWLIARQVAQVPILAGAWTALTTFLPEIGIVALWRYLRG